MTIAHSIRDFLLRAHRQQRFGFGVSSPKLLLTVIAISVLSSHTTVFGQPQETSATVSPTTSNLETTPEFEQPEFEEIVVNFEVQRLLNVDLFAQYDGTDIYMPVLKVLDVLGMHASLSESKGRITGYLNSKSEKFELDITRHKARSPFYDGPLAGSEFHFSNGEIYLRVDLFEPYFGFAMKFYFGELRVFLPLDKSFPTYQRIKRELAHKKLRAKEVEVSDVHTLARESGYLAAGVADWSLSANPIGGAEQFANLTIGGMLGGGDIDVAMAGDTRQGFDSKQLRIRWRRFFDNKAALSQVELGDVFVGSSLSRAIRGGRITNKPLTQRKFFETVNLSGDLGPNWEVELYVDGRLKDFTTTDAEGRYDFNLDVFYGASVIILKMYGPNGEVRTEERYRRIPFNLIPSGQFDYDIGVGEQEIFDTSGVYSNASVSYGLMSNLTIGAGADLPLTPTENEKTLFTGELALQLLSNLTLNTSMSPKNEKNFGLSYTQSNINLAVNYTNFDSTSKRNILRQIDKLTVSVSSPFKIWNQNVGVRFHTSIDKFPTFKTTNMNYGFNASLPRINLNYLGKYKINSSLVSSSDDISSQLFATITLSRVLRPQLRIEYNHSRGGLTKYGLFLSRRVLKTGQVTLALERNPALKTNTAMLTFSMLTDFASLTSRSITSAGGVSVNQLYRGSIHYDQNSGSVYFDRNNGVGLGAAVVKPFLDDNYNGQQDEGEEELKGLRAKIDGAGGAPKRGDDLYYYSRLRPYDEYIVKIDEYSLDDPQLKPLHENYRVAVNPNMVTSIKVPVVTASDISGSIRRTTDVGPVGVGGIKLVIFNISRDIMTQVATFNDGEYYHLGLLPGRYRAYVEPSQLESYGYKSTPQSIEFEIKPEPGGSTIEAIDFLLSPALKEVETDNN